MKKVEDHPIPVNQPLLDGNERAYLNECIDSGWISSEGPFVERFENAFARAIDRRECISVSNGTDALELAVRAVGIGPGDEVILPSFTIISCVSAVIQAGAVPVLVDSEPVSWNMDVTQIADKITPRTKAIMVVHIYGLPVDMDAVLALCEKYGLILIEDSAESIGLDYKGKPCGSFGDISTFSFYANKHVTTGEGGMVGVNDPELANRCRYLRNLGFKNPRFIHDELAWNMRMTNIQAAVGLAQTERLSHFIELKKKMGLRYHRLLESLPGAALAPLQMSYADNVFWVYGMVLDDDVPFDAKETMRQLAERKIGSRPFFWPMHEQPVLKKMGLFEGERYPVSERIARRGFYVPSGLSLSNDEIDRVAKALFEVLS